MRLNRKAFSALRSPARPNPIGLHVARLVAVDIGTGRIDLDAIDVLDGTPVIDIKPYFASTDAFPEATIAGRDEPDRMAMTRRPAAAAPSPRR